MTNGEDEPESCEARLVGLHAVHLVGQVLDEAYVIANAALESGQPWHYQAMLRNLRDNKRDEADAEDDQISFVASKGDSNVNENKIQHSTSVVVTSTPQKVPDDTKNKVDSNIIGQGDEDLELRENELNKSTSMFINHLFDMSEVERVILCDDPEITQINSEPSDLLTQAMFKIMDSYVNSALSMAFEVEHPGSAVLPSEKCSKSSERSAYSFLADACATEVGDNIAFCTDHDFNSNNEEVFEGLHITASDEVQEITDKMDQNSKENCVELYGNTYLTLNRDYDDSYEDEGGPLLKDPKILNLTDQMEQNCKEKDVELYGNTYLTLNRDYDQCSEDEGGPLLQDPKSLNLQEIELITANSSEVNVCDNMQAKGNKELTATAIVSASASGSRRSTLGRRCRIQGAKLLSCFRGWWCRKPPVKEKELRFLESTEGMCPLSPSARRRTSSLSDDRIQRSSSPSRPLVWKFNTVTEALVNSSRWKDYAFELKDEE